MQRSPAAETTPFGADSEPVPFGAWPEPQSPSCSLTAFLFGFYNKYPLLAFLFGFLKYL